MSIPQSSKIYDVGIFPTTRTITSMKTRIYSMPFNQSNFSLMAAVSSFTGGGSNKTSEEIRGIGMGDIILDLAVGETTLDDINISRAAFFGDNLLQAMGFAGGVDGLCRSLQGVRYPITLTQEILGFVIDPVSGGSLTTNKNQSFSPNTNWYDDPGAEYLWAKNASAADKQAASKKFASLYGSEAPITQTSTLLNSNGDKNAALSLSVITYQFENAWITSYQRGDFAANGSLITETMTLKYTRITNGDPSYWPDLQKTAFSFGS